MKLAYRTFIISGGSSGLGLATAQALLSQGAHAVILDLKPPLSPLSPPSNVEFIETDITSLPSLESAVSTALTHAKTHHAPLGGVINCAGIAVPSLIIDGKGKNPHPLDIWELVLNVNLTGSFNLTRLVVEHLVDVEPEVTSPDAGKDGNGERGVVIFVSSSAAYEGQSGQTAYAASKGALRSMTLPLARDLARHNIRVVTIAPGAFTTPMTSLVSSKATKSPLDAVGTLYPRRFGEPREFAEMVRFVLENGYVNGETIRLSGGGRLPAKM